MYQFLYAMPYIDIRGWGWGAITNDVSTFRKLWNSKVYGFIYLFIYSFVCTLFIADNH